MINALVTASRRARGRPGHDVNRPVGRTSIGDRSREPVFSGARVAIFHSRDDLA
jgi:hypothetical protein